MYVDTSRIKDLEMLQKWMDSPNFTPERKQMFHRTVKKIVTQMKDPRLGAMRERLMKATKAEDKLEMWKITNQIKDYMHEEKLEEGTI
jgi:hypothetical protein